MDRVVHRLNHALHELMKQDPDLFVLGEDLLDPYGGAFKVTKGLSSAFPDRVLTTPISEASIVGVGAGLALQGKSAIVELMFGDFITLAADQLINQISKMVWMYNEPLPVRLVVRTPMGGRRGYGPTHSQSLESLFLGVPGLCVVAASPVYDPALVLSQCLELHQPVVLVEHKVMYNEPCRDEAALSRLGFGLNVQPGPLPAVTLTPIRQGVAVTPDVTLITYGGMTSPAIAAARRLAQEDELDCEIVVAHQLSPLPAEPFCRSALRSRRVVVVEEGVTQWGWGAEVAAVVSSVALQSPCQRVGSQPTPIPASRDLEDRTLPQVQDIVDAAIRTVDVDFDGQPEE